MSVFKEATNYIHGDKLWSWNPVNHLKDIKITPIGDETTGMVHFVLSIPRYKMRGNASVWSDFSKSNGESQRYKLVVQWFLHYIYEIGKQDKDNQHGDNCIVFIESVRSRRRLGDVCSYDLEPRGWELSREDSATKLRRYRHHPKLLDDFPVIFVNRFRLTHCHAYDLLRTTLHIPRPLDEIAARDQEKKSYVAFRNLFVE